MNPNKIYVGNLSYDVSNQDLTNFFSQFGELEDVKLITDRETGRSKGFAFVTYKTKEGAQASLSSDGAEFKNRKLRVNIAKEDSRRRTGGGGGGGGGGGRHHSHMHN